MIIELEDDNGDAWIVDTERASREELAKACIMLNRDWRHVGQVLDRQDNVLADRGLRLDETADFPLEITDDDEATAWFAKAKALRFIIGGFQATEKTDALPPEDEAARKTVVDRLAAMRGPGESYSDVILRLIEMSQPPQA